MGGKPKIIGVYKITSPTSKVYIGQSQNIHARWGVYRGGYCPHQRKLFSSLKKYGHESHKFEVLRTFPKGVTQNELNENEVKYWKFYLDKGFNMLNIKTPGSNGKPSEETRRLISIANKGRACTPETARKISEATSGVKHYSFGVPKSEEFKAFMRKTQTGNSHGLGYKHTPEQNAAKSERQLLKNKGRKSVIQFTKSGKFIQEWVSGSEAGRQLGISRGHICSTCLGGRPAAGGFVWKYKVA